jgi:hypothetical protein
MPVAGQAAVADAYCSGPPTNVLGQGDHEGAKFAETFSPINGGYLTGVRLFVQEEQHVHDTLTVQITAVNGSDLSPVFPVVPMATSTISDSSLTPEANYPYLTEVAFEFSNPPPVSASSEYAIVFGRSDSSGVLGLGIVGTGGSGDPCPDGALYDSATSSSPWGTADSNHDAVFTTFVGGPPTGNETPPLPPPKSTGPTGTTGPTRTGKRAAALTKCKKKHSRKAKKMCRKKARALPV